MNDDDIEPGREHQSAARAAPDDDIATLSAFVDDELAPAERAALEAKLADDKDAADRVFAYRAQQSALQALGRANAAHTSSPSYLVLRPRDPWWWRFGRAAVWCVAGAGVALAATAIVPRGAPGSARGASAYEASAPDAFARHADIAYAVYTPEQRHPVEVGARDGAHLVAWLSRRLGKPLSVPSLSEYGYALVGGRLLPGMAGPAAQFMYENGAGERLTLYVGHSDDDRGAVRLLRDGDRRTFYWSSDRMGYAVSGPTTEPKLRDIAYDICGALGGKPAAW